MKKILLFAVCLLIAVSASAQSFKNGDFESGNIEGWYNYKKMRGIKTVDHHARSGKYSLEVKGGASNRFTLEKGKYEVTLYCQVVYGTARITLDKETAPKSYKFEPMATKDLSVMPDYQPVKFTVKIKDKANCNIVVAAVNNNATFYVDDITVEKK
ncbi:MAG: hypothetical protein SNH01_03830 [Rikenellaceae bacterium]